MKTDMLLGSGAARLAEAGIDNARAEARLLLAHALGVGRDATLSVSDVTSGQATAFDGFIGRRAAREPFAYIVGRKEFWSLEFAVGPGVLVPRPETETLIEQAITFYPGRPHGLSIADLGTGSGCLLVVAMREFPASLGLGIDSSRDAIKWARINGLSYNLPARAEMRLDRWDAAPEEAFDLVFCNPPYISSDDIDRLEPEVSRYEPRAALDGGPDGLACYRALATLLPRILKPGGHAFLEIGVGQAGRVEPLFRNLEIRALASDLLGGPRCLVLEKPDNALGKARPIR
ncbi:MAG TPA: peptide chain release factor N(5)-glutamine methyltransferase [Rhizomicrobium sp.]|jgi:release factor glutamine methyltransferase|nr:peptide chain release factor N(5)-glutamine methyltransferase [Rhizomicrobium sp.]